MENNVQSSTNKPLIALVTGANQGIGFQIANALVAKGYIVYLGARNLTNGELAAAKIGPNAHAVHLDVNDQSLIETTAEQIKKDSGHLDLLVNNAGISHAGKPGRSMEEVLASGIASSASLEEVKAVWDTNVFSVIAVTQAMLPLLRKSVAARIVNVSSGLGSLTWMSDPNNPYRKSYGLVYSASKTAQNAVTMAFAIELEKENIKVNAVSPGFTATALNNFQGTDSVEVGSREPIRVALETGGPTNTFTGPDGPLPW
jgi:NAD(P)-dependent dehydrogenase (short-subunit alcohol dehydrogenase family)